MAEFSSTDSYRQFEQAVKFETRYVHDAEVQDFLATVIETSQTRKDSIEESTVHWRAQRGYIWRMENAGTEEEFDADFVQRLADRSLTFLSIRVRSS
jgi:hypothetical protein